MSVAEQFTIEGDRAQALKQYGLLDSPPDPALNDISRLAAQLCSAPIAMISIVDTDRVWHMSTFGTEIRESSRLSSPWATSFAQSGVFVVPDAAANPKYAPHGIVVGSRHCRFYAGTPLIAPEGPVIGTLCVLDDAPRTLSREQADALLILARQVITRLELHAKLRSLEREARAKQRVEQALTVERNFVSAVLDTMGALVLVFDTAGRVVRFNRACEMLSGYSFGELVGRPFWERLVPREEVEETIRVFSKIRAGDVPETFENVWVTRHGRRRISWAGTALKDAQGESSYIIATGIDITEQREAQETLVESEARHRQIIEGSLGLICTHDLGGKLLSINPHAANSLGYQVGEMVGNPVLRFIPAEYHSAFQSYLDEIRERGESEGLLKVNHRDGEVRVIAYRNTLISVESREPFVLGHGIDITEKTKAEEALRGAIRQVNTILESAGDGIYSVDMNGRITLINHAALMMLGYESPEEVLGQSAYELFHHSTAEGMPLSADECMVLNSTKTASAVRVDNEVFWRKNGTSFAVEYVACPQIDEGRPVGTVVVFDDVTERRALDRMKDEFISTVSHELRTPLTSLRAALGLIAGGALQARPEKVTHMMEVAIGNCDRLVALVNDILDLEKMSSGKLQLHPVECSTSDLLQQASDLLQSSAHKAGIQLRVDAPPLTVYADPNRVMQALTNVIGNAIKFSPSGTVVVVNAVLTGPDEVTIGVHDKGRGIPADKIETIFERFQQVDASDARAGGGTGLGLAICRSIVAQHGGHIWAESEVGVGSSFYFTLPRYGVAS